ncbi:transporter [Paenibacillus sp. BIHB 4019]|uniref:Transporter n=1 Tax=Paenibacillus sp. BIHB 4019 TaxID=1870819 RepID=A0A1B2DNH7_9BACL|nr:DMT family transporter [Paenibacillus sp. BIHB 4019]ANY69269.1 transporter [Paenibacillus sp. BIHB 4019]
MKDKSIKLAYIFAVLNAVIIGFSFLFAKLSLGSAQPLDTLTFRFAFSFLIMTIPVALGMIKLNYRGKPLFKALLLAAMYPLGFFTLQAFGLLHASSAEGGILYAFTPVVTMIIASIFLKERTSLLQKLSIFLSVFGVVFIFMMKGSSIDLSNMLGISLLFLTCFAFAGYSVLARSLSKHFSPAELTYLMLGIGFGVFLSISLVQHTTAGTLGSFLTPLRSGSFLLSIFYLGVISSLITSLTSNYILGRIEASKMSVFTNLSTIVSMAGGALFLGEELTMYHVIGSLFIIAGVVGTNLLGSKRKRPSPSSGGKATVSRG